MLTKIEVRNRRGDALILPFEDWDSGYGVAGIEGLDPTKATIVTSGIAGQDGVQHYSSKREPRSLKLKLELIPDFVDTSVQSLRQQLYRYLMPKSDVTLRFFDHLGSYVDVVGVVEDFNGPLFTQDPVADIDIFCSDPDFFDPNPFSKSGVTVTGSDVTMTTVPYLGSVESGILFTMNLDRNLNAFSIVHQTPSGSTYQLDFAETLLAGDKLVISTISGSKGASLTRNNAISSVLWGVSPQAKYLELEGPGDNLIRVSATAAGIPWNIQYVNRHGGL